MDIVMIVLFSLGLGLVLAEIFLPGGIAVALGFSFILVAALRYFGHAASVPKLLVLWIVIAPVCVAAGMFCAQRFFGGKSSKKPYDEDAALIGEIGEVIEPIGTENDSGRIRWRQTSWSARSRTIPLPVGAHVRVLKQVGLSLLVESIPESKEKIK